MIAIANCGGISAPFLFPSGDSPFYSKGNWIIFAFLMVAAIMTIFTWYTLGSHAGYRIEEGDEDMLEGVDGKLEDSNEMTSKAVGGNRMKEMGV